MQSVSRARALPLPPRSAVYFLSLSMVPLLGSLITEPAAMTLAALMLRDEIFHAVRPIDSSTPPWRHCS